MSDDSLVTRFVRIHPYEPKRGHKVKRYGVFGIMFQESVGWYQVKMREEQFDILSNIVQNPESNETKPVFDICTESERKDLERRERIAKAPKPEDVEVLDLDSTDRKERKVSSRVDVRAESVDLTTADLRKAPEETYEPEQEPELEDGKDMAPAVPVVSAEKALDGAPVKRGRGRPRKDAVAA